MTKRFKAVIFDFNGVLVDDEPLHLELLQRLMQEEGLTLAAEFCRQHCLGVPDHACLQKLWQSAGRAPLGEDHLQRLIERKATYYLEAVRERDLFFPGACELVRKLAAELPLALVSGALRQEVESALKRGGLRACFNVIVTTEDVAQGKPHPAGFLRALAELNKAHAQDLSAHHCLVIEDSLAGVEAAKRAGMFCVAVTHSFAAEALNNADLVIPDLSNSEFEQLLS